ncbi:unnamed protein product [Allacma fusca]|uniref:PPPDE domain-containing protein n=1 Tax=Allacma fusca TaxID=39272 RepID=A0A8J2LE92_9HEXA|nr:unnamed protein product [Allacma fusca]
MESCNQNWESSRSPSTQVFSFNWDLSNGYRKYGFGFTNNIFQHVGLLAFGTLYEYSDQGIIRTGIPPNQVPTSACIAGDLVSCKELGKTSEVKEEFERWLDKQEAADFSGEKYHIVKNNCVSFAIRACEKLDVPKSDNWVNVAKYANYIPSHFSSLLRSSSATLESVLSKLKASDVIHSEQKHTETNPHSEKESKL